MAHAADGCDEALLPRARAAARDRPSTSGRSFAAVASAALALGGIASLAAFAGTSSLGHPTARASLGSARDGDPALRVPSAHRGGAKPPVFVVSSVDPGEDAAFDAFKRDVLLDALRAPPDFAERASWAGAASATHLPEKIERYEEACEVFEHGLATLTGTYVGQTHAWSDGGSPFFELDEGKKMTVTKRAARRSKALKPALPNENDRKAKVGSSSSSSDDTEEGEISEVEKKAVGDAVGGAVSHLLAWRRARSAAADSSNANAKTKLSTPGGGALVMDVGLFRLADDPLVGASWSSALDAVTAYRPRDADVVFLDVDADALGDKNAPTQTLKMGGDVREVSFHRHDGSVGDGGNSASSDRSHLTPLNPAMYFVTDAFLTKAFHEIDSNGFGFVAEFLREKCAAKVFNCYATTPRFAARGNSLASDDDSSRD